ncbi:hypothetical protein H257_16440 [Aphanomyces astaci]|uniref:FYVE-type domain-containing protein n=1 Tax=Aphanomyces astaci TaxID=112090 RepID=W4FKG1_APHAT|nr:hypothetical protein H257_16440 [Aphanomyces astaci]ETV67356.1 hypothetical protein H257_16440 [Aphanomyces astaci]|eukprot:XP_009843171.1 hypothetical protein H257_16440 [Aphanomyces astaci]
MVLPTFLQRHHNHHHDSSASLVADVTLNDILSPSYWVDKKDRVGCADCGLKFNNLYRRRHHCRLCGDLFCKPCVVHTRLVCAVTTTTSLSPNIKICRGCANNDQNSPTLTGSASSLAMMSMFTRRPSTTNSKPVSWGQLSQSCRGRLVSAPPGTTEDSFTTSTSSRPLSHHHHHHRTKSQVRGGTTVSTTTHRANHQQRTPIDLMPTESPPPTSQPRAVPSATTTRLVVLDESTLSSRLLQIVDTSTATQTQLASQQHHMVETLTSHTDMIQRLALAIERMESKLASPLDENNAPSPIAGA